MSLRIFKYANFRHAAFSERSRQLCCTSFFTFRHTVGITLLLLLALASMYHHARYKITCSLPSSQSGHVSSIKHPQHTIIRLFDSSIFITRAHKREGETQTENICEKSEFFTSRFHVGNYKLGMAVFVVCGCWH